MTEAGTMIAFLFYIVLSTRLTVLTVQTFSLYALSPDYGYQPVLYLHITYYYVANSLFIVVVVFRVLTHH